MNTERRRARRGPVPGTESARRGGEAVREKYGREFFQQIGRKGGSEVRLRHGADFYSEIGGKGGCSTRDRMDPGFYARIGARGGRASGAARRRNAEARLTRTRAAVQEEAHTR